MALYLSTDERTGQNNVITINSSMQFQRRVIQAETHASPTIEGLQTIFVTSAITNWQCYFDDLEKRLNRVVSLLPASSNAL
jgi:hypothetical protein